MVTHIDIARKRFDISRFTLQELAQALKVSYGLARKYALQWVEDGLVTKIKRSSANVSDNFVFVRSRMPEESMAALEELYNTPFAPGRLAPDDDDIGFPPIDPNDPWFNDYSLEDKLLEEAPILEKDLEVTIDYYLQQIMETSLNWKARALTAEKDNDRIKQALAEFLIGLKSEDF